MATKKISELDPLASVDRSTDLLEIVDTSGGASNKITVNSMLGITGNPVGHSDTQTLTNKTLTSPTITSPTLTALDSAFTLQDNADSTKQAQFQLSGITTGTTRTYTMPNASTTLVGTDATQTLTNKTLTAPTISNPTLTVDSISEFSAAAGVTIDGMLIKDGTVGPGTITPAGLLAGTGSSWAWQSWVPTLTNLSGGTLTYANYLQIGKVVVFRFRYVLAGAGVSGTPRMTLPVTASSTYDVAGADSDSLPIVGELDDITGSRYFPSALFASTSSIDIHYFTATPAIGIISSTSPFTWASGDVIQFHGLYEAA